MHLADSQSGEENCEEESIWDTDSDSSDAEEEEPSFIYQLAAEKDHALVVCALEAAEEKVLEPEKEALFEAPIPLGECPICYEELKMIDFTVTKCGHTFHSSCVFKAMEQNVDCPMCRCQLLEVQEYEESVDEEEGEDQEDQEDDDDDSDDEDDPKVTLEQLYAKLQNMGYTPLDILSRAVYPNIILKRQDESRNVTEFQDELGEKIWDLVYGNISLAHVDQRTYAQVAAKIPDPHVQPQPQVAAV